MEPCTKEQILDYIAEDVCFVYYVDLRNIMHFLAEPDSEHADSENFTTDFTEAALLQYEQACKYRRVCDILYSDRFHNVLIVKTNAESE